MICKSCKNEIPDNAIFCQWCGEKQLKERKKKKKDEIKIPEPRQKASGKWIIELRAEGISKTFDTADEARAWAKATRAGFIEQKAKLPRMTVGDAVDKYIADNSNILSPSTIRGYKTIRRTRFKSLMGKEISENIDWNAAVNSEAAIVSPKTVSNAWRFIATAIKAIGFTPPRVRLPQIPKAQREWLDYGQILVFLGAVKGTSCELGALLALHGLRRSEIFALTSDDIDLKNKTINVSGAMVYNDENQFVHKETNKNRSSQRIVPILIPRLEELLIDSSGQLITYRPNKLWEKINAVCRKAELPEVGVHGLRHSFASLAYHLKWSEATTMSVGGWSDTKTVHEIYTHLANQDKNKDIRRMKKFYKN